MYHRLAALLLLWVAVLAAGSAAPRSLAQSAGDLCPAADDTMESRDRRIDCLEERLASALGTQLVLQRTILELARQIEHLQIEVLGPPRVVGDLISESLVARVTLTWMGNRPAEVFDCDTMPTPPDGFVIFGGELSSPAGVGEYPQPHRQAVLEQMQTCSGFPWCFTGAAAAQCSAQSRRPGCVVSGVWLDWLRRQGNEFLTYERVCL
jgi:hypothetical protein